MYLATGLESATLDSIRCLSRYMVLRERPCVPGYWLGERHSRLDPLSEPVHDPEVDHQAGQEGEDELNDEHHETEYG